MDVWGIFVLFINMLLLFTGWILLQQAKSDLTARAAQVPVLSEVKALQKSVASLLEQLKLEAIQTSAQLDTRCAEAKDLLAALEKKLDEGSRVAPKGARRRQVSSVVERTENDRADGAGQIDPRLTVAQADRSPDPRRAQVYELSDTGLAPTEISRQTGFSEGEVELILGLRAQAS